MRPVDFDRLKEELQKEGIGIDVTVKKNRSKKIQEEVCPLLTRARDLRRQNGLEHMKSNFESDNWNKVYAAQQEYKRNWDRWHADLMKHCEFGDMKQVLSEVNKLARKITELEKGEYGVEQRDMRKKWAERFEILVCLRNHPTCLFGGNGLKPLKVAPYYRRMGR